MVDTTFIAGLTSIDAEWLNPINTFYNNTFDAATTKAAAADAMLTATGSQQGVMSIADKGKLDALAGVSAIFSTVAQMVTDQPDVDVGTIISTSGYNDPSDGGGNYYKIVANGTGTVDGGLYINLDSGQQAEGQFPNSVLNVRQWGATTGAAGDDTDAVLAAVAAVDSHTTLYFPAGDYVVNATMDFTGHNFFSIIGDGWGASIIRRTSGTFGDTALFARTDDQSIVFGITIRDIQFHCEPEMENGAVLHIVHGQRFIVQNVYMRNVFKGIYTEGIRDSRFDNLEIVSTSTTTRAGSCHVHIGQPTDPLKVNTETFISNYNFTTGGSGDLTVDLQYSILVDGEMDGVWFVDGHSFGGNTSNFYINGQGRDKFQGLRLDNIYVDGHCHKNMILTGTSTGTKYASFTFNNCRFFNALDNSITVNSGCDARQIVFSGGCEIGSTPGQGVQLAAGEITFMGCSFRFLNVGSDDPSYAIQSANGTSRLTVMNCEFEMEKLKYGIWCVDLSTEYHFQDNIFRSQDGAISQEILFPSGSLNGTCFGNTIDRPIAGDIQAAPTVSAPNIAVDQYSLTGSTQGLNIFEPHWHGRKITIRADSSVQNLIQDVGFGNILNREGNSGPSDFQLKVNDVVTFEYNETTSKWHRV